MSVCLTPFYVNHATIQDLKVPVPCGRCPPCFARRTSHWSFRLRVEGRQHLVAYFVTLTYANTPKSKNGYSTLKKRDVQLFMKRLRKENKKYNNEKIVYYCAGEYGSQFKRPHYHLIMFNAYESVIRAAWQLDDVPLGHVHIGTVSDASIGYTLKYISKKLVNKKRHARDDRTPEFQLQSKGIGLNYLTPAMIRWHKQDPANRCLAIIEDNQKISLPRYIRDKLFNDEEKQIISNALQSIAIETEFELFKIHGKNLEAFKHNSALAQIERHNLKQTKTIDIF